MLTPKQESYCQNREVLKMTQRQAYYKAYPASTKWKPETVDNSAYDLERKPEILARIKELREQQGAIIAAEAAWTRQDAKKELDWLISRAKKEIETKGEITSPTVSALVNSVKELDAIFAVAEKPEGGGVLGDILSAVRGISCD